MAQVVFADRGRIKLLDNMAPTTAEGPTWAAASRLGSLCVALPARSIWMQMRGSCRIDSREGSFLLQRGDWIAFAGGSSPELRAGLGSLAVGLVLPAGWPQSVLAFRDQLPLIGRGSMPRQRLRVALNLWREAARTPSTITTRAFWRPCCTHRETCFDKSTYVVANPSERKGPGSKCLQCLMLHLDGNSHRTVRLSELASMAGCSIWHLSRSIRSVYGLNPSSIAQRYRLTRARHLLASTSLAIAEVGGASGFENPASFARALGSENGMSASRNTGSRCDWPGTSPAHFYDSQTCTW